MSDATPRDPSPPTPLTRSASPTGQLSILALLGLAAGAVPLPILSPGLLTRIRGAVVHEVTTRYGLSLTNEARLELSRASLTVSGGALLTTMLFLVKRSIRRLGVMGLLPPLAAWFDVYALGILLERYIEQSRSSRTVRIDEQEARTIRQTIDQAMARTLTLRLWPTPTDPDSSPVEDLRDMPTRLTDGILLAVANTPLFLRRRLETAFDSVKAGVKS